MTPLLLLLISCGISESSAQTVSLNTGWDELTTTFPKFLPVPMSESEAIATGWVRVLGCEDAVSPGNVYANGTDLASMPIYNADGNIAGIILGAQEPGQAAHVEPYKFYNLSSVNTSLSIASFWGIEALFRNPYTVCTAGSTDIVKYGDRLWFTYPDDTYYEAPLTQNSSQLIKDGWVLGACRDGVFRMGHHWWRYQTRDMDCNDAYPIFLLYNQYGKLNAWGVAMGNLDRPFLTSPRWEHPPGAMLSGFFQPDESPTCLGEQEALFNSMHVYMLSDELVCEMDDTPTSTLNTSDDDVATSTLQDEDEDEDKQDGVVAELSVAAVVGYISIGVGAALVGVVCLAVAMNKCCNYSVVNSDDHPKDYHSL